MKKKITVEIITKTGEISRLSRFLWSSRSVSSTFESHVHEAVACNSNIYFRMLSNKQKLKTFFGVGYEEKQMSAFIYLLSFVGFQATGPRNGVCGY